MSIAFGKAFDVGGDVGGFGGVVNLLVGRGVDAQGDVFADAVAEEKSFLRHESDVFAQRCNRIVADGAAVDQNHSRLGVVDARDQADQSGLAGAGGPDDGQAAAGGNAQVHVVQNLLCRRS